MSRTMKDKPHKIKFPSDLNMRWPYYNVPRGTLPKKKRNCKPDWESYYHSTPGWWVHMFMTKRRRRENRVYESILKFVPIDLLEEYEPFLNWKKPHEYYW